MASSSVKAVSKQVGMSPRKVAEVAALVQGRTVEDALTILDHTPRRAALPVSKTVASAAANAENNNKLDPKTLVVTSVEVGQGFALKRFRPAAHGRALPYKKMTSNISVTVTGSEKVKKPKKTTDNKKKADTEEKSEEKKDNKKPEGEDK